MLWDVITQRNITSGSGNASPDGLRQLAHKIADFVYEEFTGDSGYFDTQIVYVAGVRNAIPPRETSGDHGSGWA